MQHNSHHCTGSDPPPPPLHLLAFFPVQTSWKSPLLNTQLSCCHYDHHHEDMHACSLRNANNSLLLIIIFPIFNLISLPITITIGSVVIKFGA